MTLPFAKGSIEALRRKQGVRAALKTLLVLLVTSLSIAFFGLCLPFFALAFGILPSLGVGGVIYFAVGGVFGLLFGGISSACSLARSERLVTRYYRDLFITLVVLVVAYVVCYATMTERFAHV